MSEVVLSKVRASDLDALTQWLPSSRRLLAPAQLVLQPPDTRAVDRAKQDDEEGCASRLRARLEAQKEAASAKM